MQFYLWSRIPQLASKKMRVLIAFLACDFPNQSQRLSQSADFISNLASKMVGVGQTAG